MPCFTIKDVLPATLLVAAGLTSMLCTDNSPTTATNYLLGGLMQRFSSVEQREQARGARNITSFR